GALLGDNRATRERTLTDDELDKLWHGVEAMDYPYTSVYRLLILTGLRLNEVARAHWSELDLQKRLWTIPAARMKSKRDHVVPLCDAMVDIIKSLPRFRGGDYVFSVRSGASPVAVASRVKLRLDKLVGVDDWVNHDIRRTVRTNLSRLPIEEHVRELMIAHT